jgi:hypothetical protein
VCVADADFDDEVLNRAAQWFLVFTDNADLDTMCYASPALARALDAWGSKTKLATYGGVDLVRAKVEDVIRPVSVLRRANVDHDLGLRFDAVNLYDVVSKESIALNLNGLVDRLSRASAVPVQEVAEMLDGDEPICIHTGSLLMRGRDCFTVVDVALRKAIGNLSHQQVKDGLAQRSVRLAVRAADLAHAPFVARIRTAATRAVGVPSS